VKTTELGRLGQEDFFEDNEKIACFCT